MFTEGEPQVKYANDNGIPFMAVNRGHALTKTVAGFKGIQIDMKALTKISVQPGGKTAWLQGGTYNGPVIDELWEQGYVASEYCKFTSILALINIFGRR